MMKIIIIAIDGFSSCGKSTLARQLAKELGYIYIDSGAMYRAVTLSALQNNLIGKDFFDEKQFIKKLPGISIKFELDNNFNPVTILNNKNVEDKIRNIEVSSYVSIISKLPQVREKMVALQRDMGKNKAIVMDGRDIGTVVFPEAEIKIFLTADLEIRAKRRYDELKAKNIKVDFDVIKANIIERDNIDRLRTNSPLKKAPDSIIIDNSNISKQEQLKIALAHAKKIINEG